VDISQIPNSLYLQHPICRPFSILNPARRCNSDLAQYPNTPLPQPHFSSTTTSNEHEDDVDAPGEHPQPATRV